MPIQVTLDDYTGNVSHQAKLAENAPAGQLIPAIITSLNLPITDNAGRPIIYHLSHNNRHLQEDETLEAAHVQQDDIIVIVPEMTAGGGYDLLFVSTKQTAQEYKDYVLSLILKYDKQASKKKILNHVLQLVILIGSALVTVIVASPDIPKIIPILFSGLVTITTAIAYHYKFGEQVRELTLTAEEMAIEYNKFNTGRGDYSNIDTDKALSLFMDRMENLMHEQTKHIFALEQLKEEQK